MDLTIRGCLIMRRYFFVLVTTVLFCVGAPARAETVEYVISVDDYGQLYIDGVLRASYDASPHGGARTGELDLTPGWHDIEIVYKNRWGSNALGLYKTTGPNPGDLALVPKERLRSINGAGETVPGLTADYYDLNGAYVTTVYGEGPIFHSWYNYSPPVLYQGVPGALWAGIYDGWGLFEERLSGQILVGPDLVTVTIDIKPGSYPNCINLGSNGVIPVAILSDANFDATTVDPETVSLAGAGVAVRGKGNKYLAHAEDVNEDDVLDLVLKMETENLDPDLQSGYAIIAGTTFDGIAFTGQDEIVIVPLDSQ